MATEGQAKPTKPEKTPDLVAQTLASVRKSVRGASGTSSKKRSRNWSEGPQFSGSGPDERDPALLSESMKGLMRENGWEHKSKVGGVVGRWAQIVGADLASHVTPEVFDEKSGRLVLRAESTTWATQVRSLIPMLQQKLDDEIGAAIVREIEVRGPARKSRSYGPLRVKGRGDRDTYG
ncbi:MAG: DciA family protein [Candidatus Nanopelagicales bacterium]